MRYEMEHWYTIVSESDRSDQTDQTERLEVPGGWLYRSGVWSRAKDRWLVLTMVFVPEPKV
jgi:hypothetical protein